MTSDEQTTIRSRELGDALRLAMERANLNGKYVAHVLGWSESRVSRMLTGRQQPLKDIDVVALLALCRVTGDEKEHLLELARGYQQRGLLQQFDAALPEQLRTLINHESRATEIIEFEAIRIPGLLQTNDYMRALLERSAVVPPEGIEPRVVARRNRQNIFGRYHSPKFTFLIHEQALQLPVGGPGVLSDQLHHLLQMSVRSYVTIRVIPIAFGPHAAMCGACRLMESDDFKPVVYIEEQTAGHFLEEPREIATYRKIFTALANSALDQEESRSRIAELAVSMNAE
ncbi:MAG TPA: helix-turn-helix transcriptional regulator [Pseudonocardiaceae bacterium]|jgi:transcriptional regulator with XRE-family HTH domain|nr:helix-turn-helix transcriptional regulator [Pseudonocardiaceae bacterium]